MTGIKIDLGCGLRKAEGHIGIDRVAAPGVDHVLDLEREDLPFPDGSVDEVRANHVLEHLTGDGVIRVMNEVHRVLRPGGAVRISVPAAIWWARSKADGSMVQVVGSGAFRDPTHRTTFTKDTFRYWTQGYMENADYGIRGWFRIVEGPDPSWEIREGHDIGVNLKVVMEAVK